MRCAGRSWATWLTASISAQHPGKTKLFAAWKIPRLGLLMVSSLRSTYYIIASTSFDALFRSFPHSSIPGVGRVRFGCQHSRWHSPGQYHIYSSHGNWPCPVGVLSLVYVGVVVNKVSCPFSPFRKRACDHSWRESGKSAARVQKAPLMHAVCSMGAENRKSRLAPKRGTTKPWGK